MKITAVPANPLRLVNTQHDALHTSNTDSAESRFSDTIAANDLRWLFATRVQMMFSTKNRIQSIGQLNDLIEVGVGMGFSEMYARVIVGIVEEAQLRGGLDRLAMSELMDIPCPVTEHGLSNRARWITFGVLFGWSFVIAGLMQLV
mgnify:CR=1 FL=1